MQTSAALEPLVAYFRGIPPIGPEINSGMREDGAWWVKFHIDITHPGAWKAVMDLGYVLNWLSLADPLPTVFKPVSAPPDMNGNDPQVLLWWVVQCFEPSFTPAQCAHALEVSLFDYG